MKQEDKELLLKDLSARLPYNCKVFYEYVDDLDSKTYGYSLTLNTWCIDELNADKAVIKPYLRPMSSMTEEEDKEWQYYKNKIAESCDELLEDKINQCHDFFNAHHLDFRNLIERGLAIEVTEENNPYKE